MQLMYDPRHREAIARWAGRFFEGGDLVAKSDWAIGIIDDAGVLRGAFIGKESNDWTVEVAFASEGGITFPVVRHFFRMFFAKYSRMEIHTSKHNKTVKRNAVKWGFVFEGTARGYYGKGRDALCYRMLPSECRWLRKDNGISIRLKTKGAKADRSERHRAAAGGAEHQERKHTGPV